MWKILAPLLLLSAGASVASWRAMGEGASVASRDTGDLILYVARGGDSLEALADRHFLEPSDWRKARALNRIDDPGALQPGARLLLDVGWLKRTPLAAEVIAFRGAVTARVGGRPVEARRGLLLSEGDRIETGPVGFVTLRFPDGSEVSLPTNSAIKLERLRRYTLNNAIDRRLAVERGGTRSRVEPIRDPTSRYEVGTPTGVAAVRGTDFRVRFTPGEERALLTVLEGRVGAFVAGGPETAVLAAQGLVMDAQGVGETIALPPAPEALDVPLVVDSRAASFAVTADPDLRYRALLATDEAMRDQVAEAQSQDGRFRFDSLGAGTYFLEVSAITPEGLEGLPARFRFEQRHHAADRSSGDRNSSGRGEGRERPDDRTAGTTLLQQALPAPVTPGEAAVDSFASAAAAVLGEAEAEEEGDSSEDAPGARGGGGGNAPAAWSALGGATGADAFSGGRSGAGPGGWGGWGGGWGGGWPRNRSGDEDLVNPPPLPPVPGGGGGPVVVPPPALQPPPALPPAVIPPVLPAPPGGSEGASGGILLPSAPPAIPEPRTWAMFIVGFGMVGLALRRRHRALRCRQRAGRPGGR
ncbi:MAG: FecR domain-containing protein [Sphingomonadaceae bacterium]